MVIQFLDTSTFCSVYERLQFRIILFGFAITINLVEIGATALSIFTAFCVLKLWRGLKAIHFLPGIRVPFQPLSLPGAAFGYSRINPGLRFPWVRRHDLYKTYGSENVSVVPFVSGIPTIYTSNLDVARQVIMGKHKVPWIKPESASGALLLWGMNLVASDGDMWRKHRRIMAPAFNVAILLRVWEKAMSLYDDMIATEGWSDKDVVDVPVVQRLTFKLALLVIGSCAFGFPFTWASPATAPDGSMSIEESLRIVSETNVFAISAPWFAWYAPIGWVQEIRRAHEKLREFMTAEVSARKALIREEIANEVDEKHQTNDVFSMLVRANELESEKFRLDDNELFGNVYILLLAGHETTAHALAATLGLLAFYDDVQEEVYEHIVSTIGHDRKPVFNDYRSLNKVRAAFYEALRMYPSGHVMIREATEDTVLTIPNPPGKDGSSPLPVQRGAQVVVDMVGVHYNSRYLDEPEKFKPSRWYNIEHESETFTAFSVGPRACIGRKFAETEAVSFLTLLLRDWKVEPLLLNGETKEQWGERALEAEIVITLGAADVPLRFIRRKGL